VSEDGKCEDCNGRILLDETRGEYACVDCGLVAPEAMLVRPNEDDASYHRGPAGQVRTDSSLATTFYDQSRDANGHVISEGQRDKVRRMAFVNSRTRKYKEKAMGVIQTQVAWIGARLELPHSIRERSFFIAKTAYERHLFAGREFSVFAAACVYLAAREKGAVLIPKDLVAVIDTVAKNPVSQVFKVFHKLKREFKVDTKTVTPEQILPVVASKLFGDDRALLLLAEGVLKEIRATADHDPQHRKPEVDVAAAIWVVALRSGLTLSQPEICRVCQVSDVAVRTRMYELFPSLVKSKKGDQ